MEYEENGMRYEESVNCELILSNLELRVARHELNNAWNKLDAVITENNLLHEKIIEKLKNENK